MIYIFHSNVTPRWKYVLDFVFQQRGIDYSIEKEASIFSKKEGSRINIDPFQEIDKVFSFKSPFLEEHGPRKVELTSKENQPLIDGVHDLFGGIFYVLSAYEEYLSDKRDQFGRFSAEDSVLVKHDWLMQPIADVWAEEIIAKVNQNNNEPLFTQKKEVEIIPTFDIDNAYAFKGKGLFRNILALGRDKFRLDIGRVLRRYAWFLGWRKDPYDSHEFILSIAKEFPVHVFWLTESSGGKDNNISMRKRVVRDLIEGYQEKVRLGIHPSFSSDFGRNNLKNEMDKLSGLTKQPVLDSRMHFLRLKTPETFRALIAEGICVDHSYGFADRVGFRIGTARRIPWFDVERNEETSFALQPFVYMDGSLNEYMKLQVPQAQNLVTKLYEQVEKYGGNYVFLWHNETITDFGKWKGWSAVLRHTLQLKKHGK